MVLQWHRMDGPGFLAQDIGSICSKLPTIFFFQPTRFPSYLSFSVTTAITIDIIATIQNRNAILLSW